MSNTRSLGRNRVDPDRLTAFRILRDISQNGAFAHIAIGNHLRPESNASLITELVHGTCRGRGTYDQIIAAAASRTLKSLQPAVVDVLRLGSHQLLGMRTPTHAAVAATVELAKGGISPRVSGVVNAIMRKIAVQDFNQWVEQLSTGLDEIGRLALTYCHPEWVVRAYAEVLPIDELPAALAANNLPPVPTLVVRPGLITRDVLFETVHRGQPEARITPYSPYGVIAPGNPEQIPEVVSGLAGVQDEGSQLAVLIACRAAIPGDWLDLCAGPGGKTALLTGLVSDELTAVEIQPHRAELVTHAVRAYPNPPKVVVVDGTKLMARGRFTNVLADVPCSGLGALRRRSDSRWRKKTSELEELTELQGQLLTRAIEMVTDGVVTYVTCSPHRAETEGVIAEVLANQPQVSRLDTATFLPEVPKCRSGTSVQLWPHRHGTDAMFIAALRVSPK